MGGWQSDKPGILRHLTPGDLSAISEDVQAYSRVVSRPDGAMPQVPAGFSVEMVGSGFDVPRVIRAAPNGDLFLAESGANRVRVLRLASDGSKLSKNEIFASGLRQPYGIAFYPLGPTGEYEDFMTGFVLSDQDVWGRPVGVTVARDGSLLVTDDGNGTIWRVTYKGDQAR
jgi:glucose/arabinose dehydrogenase